MLKLENEYARLEVIKREQDFMSRVKDGFDKAVKNYIELFIKKINMDEKVKDSIIKYINEQVSLENKMNLQIDGSEGRSYSFYSNDDKSFSYILIIKEGNDEIRFEGNFHGYLIVNRFKNEICYQRQITHYGIDIVVDEVINTNGKKIELSKKQKEFMKSMLPDAETNADLLANKLIKDDSKDSLYNGYFLEYHDGKVIESIGFSNKDNDLLNYNYHIIITNKTKFLASDGTEVKIKKSDFIFKICDLKATIEFGYSYFDKYDRFTECTFEKFNIINPNFDYTELKRQIKVAAEHGVDISAIPVELQPQQAQGLHTIQSSNNTVETPGAHGEGGSEPDL